jgi:cytochrome c peroxidase
VTGARARAALALCLGAASACGTDGDTPAPSPPPAPLASLVDATLPSGFGPGTAADTAPPENALTEARAELGRRLFFDGRLSRTGTVSCGSCHKQENAFSDPAPVSTGVDGRTGTRNAPALVNLAWGTSFFWDGRAASLEEQAGKPIENPLEMDSPLADAVARVAADAGYARAFADAYGALTEETLRFALASFVRTLVSASSPYDRHLAGDDAAFGAAEARGEALFFAPEGGCFHCHPRGALTNGGYFDNGTFVGGDADLGRQAITMRSGDLGKFKVPGLRNVAASAPYMHDGSLATLADVVDQYDRGGRGDPATDPQIRPLGLTPDQKADLLAFLRSLTDDRFLTDPRFAP